MNVQSFRERQQTVMLEGIVGEPVRVSYTDIGSGPPMLLLHGIPTWSFLFHEMIDDLAKQYRVIAPDMIGYGFSDRRDCFDRSIEVQANMVEQLLKHLEISYAHFVAHDIGGGVAMIVADRSPEIVRSMVLSNSVAYDSWPIEEMLSLANPDNTKMSPDEMKQFLSKTFEVGLSRPEKRTDEFKNGIMAPYLDQEGIRSLVRNAASLNTNHTTSLTARLNKLNQPTLFLWGEDDNWQPISTAERLVEDMPHAKLTPIKKCSHWVPQDAPDEFTRETLNFLESVDASVANA
ncbi:alpha/beta fold hydrolase [Bremerella sp. T1]|uniref:alpha/beta fold hydrolase n=1 Tax=Bremerella sp. TYQ1 TaxID=3119568 RepID=UPI001CC99B83|nr:alpha/beta hydrolase [Bremerella volcania]UBM38346.1 alpha/beta hydrolase [Bremerella volcania]